MPSKLLKSFSEIGRINEIKYFNDKYLNKLKVNSPLVNFSCSERVLWRGRFDELRTLENISPCGMSAAFFSNVRFPCSLNRLFFRLPRKGDRLSPDIVKRRNWGEKVEEKQNLCATESWKGGNRKKDREWKLRRIKKLG